MQVRPATEGDLPAIRAIYAHHVLTGLASFEEEPPTFDEMRKRYAAVTQAGFPYLAADFGGQLAGYGYCSLYRTRSAYRFTVEDSIYVRADVLGKGVGRRILGELVERCSARGYRQMMAVIGDSANTASVALHASLGFLRVGTMRSVGFKHGRWVDSVIMQRSLGPGDAARPAEIANR